MDEAYEDYDVTYTEEVPVVFASNFSWGYVTLCMCVYVVLNCRGELFMSGRGVFGRNGCVVRVAAMSPGCAFPLEGCLSRTRSHWVPRSIFARRELVKLTPTLLSVAFILYITRRLSSGVSVGGGGGGGPGVCAATAPPPQPGGFSSAPITYTY